ncbi:MAG: small multi-drug export protein [Clostridia bacterium]|nr:small multi-drug export protein [Clostridia bacterium]
MLDFFARNFSECVPLAVFLISIIPTVESRTAIPFGLSSKIWGSATLSPLSACLISFAGTMLPAFLILLLVRHIKRKTSGFLYSKLYGKLEAKVQKHFKKLSKRESVFEKCLFLVGFVAVPLPLTGVYTGCLIAGLSELKLWQGFLSILIGEVISCVGITLLCVFFDNSVFYILMLSFVIGFVVFLINIISWVIKRLTSQHHNR